MHLIKPAKLYFSFAVLLFVAKPFLGFNTFTQLRHPSHVSILVKAFTKRTQEHSEDSDFNISSVLKKIADPVKSILLRFSFLLNILFPAMLVAGTLDINRFLCRIGLVPSSRESAYLLNGNLTI